MTRDVLFLVELDNAVTEGFGHDERILVRVIPSQWYELKERQSCQEEKEWKVDGEIYRHSVDQITAS